jgi:hypothetical protein
MRWLPTRAWISSLEISESSSVSRWSGFPKLEVIMQYDRSVEAESLAAQLANTTRRLPSHALTRLVPSS